MRGIDQARAEMMAMEQEERAAAAMEIAERDLAYHYQPIDFGRAGLDGEEEIW